MNDGIYYKQICFESFLTLGQNDTKFQVKKKLASATMNISALENVNFFNKIPSTFTKKRKKENWSPTEY